MQNNKEAINTFSKGLNYDLNPIGTPNDILTDCVNGTLVTFNGDEFMLQHDAGNTKISVPGGGYVSLSPGFYPIGIKEFGGVLYIVSAKDPTIVPIEYDPEDSYDEGEVTITEAGIYYMSLEDDNVNALTDVSWEYIGDEKDFKNKFGFIEFGSYPSQETINTEISGSGTDFEIWNDSETNPEVFKTLLYNPKVINTVNFSGGTYAMFELDHPSDLDYVSYDVFEDLIKMPDSCVKNIYKVKLWQQLNSSSIDLTDDVWNKYAYFVKTEYGEDLNTSTIRYWFNDPDFKYFAPSSYKGKLSISIELEDFDYFMLNKVEKTFDLVNYTITIAIDWYNVAGWDTDPFNYTICYTLNGTEPIFENGIDGNYISVGSTSYDINLLISAMHAGKTWRYKVRPLFYVGADLISYNDLPVEFLKKHTLEGTALVVDQTQNYLVSIEESSYVISGDYRTAKRLNLMDIDGNFLTNEFEISSNEYQFYLLGSDEPGFPLGTYEIDSNGMATNVVFNSTFALDPINYQNFIRQLVVSTKVKEHIKDWGYTQICVQVNKVFESVPIQLVQNGVMLVATNPSYTTQYYFNVIKGVPFTIRASSGIGVDTNTDYNLTTTVTAYTVIDFGLVTELSIVTQSDSEGWNDDYINVNMSSAVFGDSIPSSRFVLTQTNPLYGAATQSSINAGWSDSVLHYTFDTSYPTYQLVFNNTGTNIYDNLSGLTLAVEGSNIFLKTTTLTT